MSKAQKIDKAIGWLTIAGAAYFVGTAIAGAIKRKRETTSGIGYAGTPNYTLGLLNRYLSSHEIFDVQVVLNDRNKYGHYYVLCGDDQGGRDFYLSPKNIPYFKNYCLRNGIEYEAFYLPEDALSGIGKINPNRNGTRVIFRTFNSGIAKGEVIALFPDDLWMGADHWNTNYVTSYMHIGQHSGADYTGMIMETRAAKPNEYAPLLRELKEIGYDDLIIAQRR